MVRSLHYSMLRRRLMWWIMKSYYNVLRLPSAFLAFLLIGFARTFMIDRRWWYWVTHALLGFLSNLASLGALFWAISSTPYSRLIFLIYLLSIPILTTSMLTTSRLMSTVLLLNSLALLAAQFSQFTFSTSVRELGVTLDNTHSFSAHISNLSRSSFYHLRRLRAIRRSVSMPVFKSMVHAFVCSRIDYCNSLLIGLPKSR